MNSSSKGSLVISLDFELHWGAAEKWDIEQRSTYFKNTRESIPRVLALFRKYGIHATWATVGFLFAHSKDQLIEYAPHKKPSYTNKQLSYYNLLENGILGEGEEVDPYHYAPSLIEEILRTRGQEIGTHTFCHYYCNEPGQTKAQFDSDLKAAQALAKKNFDIELKSLVFPRNQFNAEYLSIAQDNGIKVVRSNPDVWFWNDNHKLASLGRAVDSILPISKSLVFNMHSKKCALTILPASRFVRPYTKQEKIINKRKLNRIKKEMSFAANKGFTYHLWWHPHNFGGDIETNIKNLNEILFHFKLLNEMHGFISKSMIESAL